MDDDRVWLVWSNVHQAWWGPARSGYFLDATQAGRYTEAEADACCRSRIPEDCKIPGRPPEVKVHINVSPLAEEFKKDEELASYKTLIRKQHERTVEADKVWRQAHPDKNMMAPDLGDLIAWLMQEAKSGDRWKKTAGDNLALLEAAVARITVLEAALVEAKDRTEGYVQNLAESAQDAIRQSNRAEAFSDALEKAIECIRRREAEVLESAHETDQARAEIGRLKADMAAIVKTSNEKSGLIADLRSEIREQDPTMRSARQTIIEDAYWVIIVALESNRRGELLTADEIRIFEPTRDRLQKFARSMTVQELCNRATERDRAYAYLESMPKPGEDATDQDKPQKAGGQA